MTNRDRILEYLRSISPRTATNNKIVAATGVRPHQQVFQITTQLEKAGQIKGRLFGHEWEYWVSEEVNSVISEVQTNIPIVPNPANVFEISSRKILEAHYGATLLRGSISGIPKIWDYLSPDQRVVGDAKFYTMVKGEGFPPAKMSVIAEYVWLLSKINAPQRFLVFGNDRKVPALWLQRYGHLVDGISFWFVDKDETLDRLK